MPLRIEKALTRDLRKGDSEFTRATLAKAFRGELVPTEFELAKAEGRSFENAAELLERIKCNGGSGKKYANGANAKKVVR